MNPALAALLAALGLNAPEVPPTSPPPFDLTGVLQSVAGRLAGPETPKFTQTETEEDLDGDNRVTSVRMTKSVQHLLPGNKQHGDVVLATEDGRDVTAKVRDYRAEKEEKSHGSREPPLPIDLEFRLPFEASQLNRYNFTRIGGSDQQPIVHFEPKADDKRLWVGQAKLDAATGTLLEMTGHPAVLPMFVDQIDVHLEFSPTAPPGPLPARTVIEGGAHFLFFHKRMRYTSITALPSGAAEALNSIRR